MAPDLNSLPPSYAPDSSTRSTMSSNNNNSNGDEPSPSPRSTSLAAAATINAGIQNQQQSQSSRRSSTSSSRTRGSPVISRQGRRRSNVAMGLAMTDPALPGPGEMQGGQGSERRASQTLRTTGSPQGISRSPSLAHGDPHHHRNPSIGELHQELEQEQEAQNRLLFTIRQQQQQLDQLQRSARPDASGASSAVEDTPSIERPPLFANLPTSTPLSVSNPRTLSPAPRRSIDHHSRRSSGASHSTRPASGGLPSTTLASAAEDTALSSALASRDEVAYYQAEAQMLTRENQMLRQRIRELERQVNPPRPSSPNAPVAPSNLAAPPMDTEEGSTTEEPMALDGNGRRA